MRDLVVLVTWKCPDCQFYSITDEPDIVAEARAAHQRAHYEQTPPREETTPVRDLTAELATSFCSVPGCPDDAHGDDGLCVYHHNLDRHHGRADRRHRADRRLTTKENT